MHINIKRLEHTDWVDYKILRLEAMIESKEAFASTYEEESQRTEVEWKQWLDAYIMGAFDGGDLVGCMTMLRNRSAKNNHAAHIYGVYIRPKYRGFGIGKMLLEDIISQANFVGIEIIYLNVTTTQVAAIGLYRSFGFVTYGVMPDSLRIGDRYFDQECMVLKLKNDKNKKIG
jgi:ribosomal protein S18 acetylase RimI-like enzyme